VAKVWQKMGPRSLMWMNWRMNLYRPRTKIWQQVVKAFGKDIVGADNNISRAALGAIVFADKKKLAKLNRIMYPAIVKELGKQLAAAKSKVVVSWIWRCCLRPKLKNYLIRLWWLKYPSNHQLTRLPEERNLSREQALDRINSMSFQEKNIFMRLYESIGDQSLAVFKKAAQDLFQKIT